jgi:ABC-type oligopeptide transport system substrate-binding subunit
MRRRLRLPSAVLAVLLLGLLHGPGARAEDSKDAGSTGSPTVFNYSDNGYANLDPAHASLYRTNDERLILGMLECLTTLDPQTGKARPGAASSWESSADRHTWTFHLRKNGVWQDGSPVTAEDFIRGWKRVMDPFTKSPWSWLYRPIKGCAAIRDNSARTEGFTDLRHYLKNLLSTNANGIPGDELNSALDAAGVRPFLTDVKSRSVRRLLHWKDGDKFPPEATKLVIEALKKERRRVKDLWEGPLDDFGKKGSGVYATDDHTLVVETEGDVPYLPELLARSAFAPLHKSYSQKRSLMFEVGGFVANGPFVLKGRGAKPPEGSPNQRVLSVVDLARNKTYNGPNRAQVDEVKCFTDQTIRIPAREDVYQFEHGKLQWVNATWPEYPKNTKKDKLRDRIEALKGYTVRDMPRVIYLRFRCDRPPFNDRSARRAFALSVNRELVARQYWPKATPAYRLVPPGIEGRKEGVRCPEPNPAGAQQAFKDAGLQSDSWIEVSFGESPGQGDAVNALRATWKKVLGNEPGWTIQSDADVRNVIRAGRYQVMLTDFRGAVNDPAAYLAPLHSKDADSGLGWNDEAYDALIDAALDPGVALADPEGWLAKVKAPSLEKVLEAAKADTPEAREALRREAMAVAEQRILDEYVVVPLLFLREATLLSPKVHGLGSDQARRNPGFVGSLVSVSLDH